jgi:hypothetical protein
MCAWTAVAAARILESLDKDSDPCEDFYQFACGGWISQHPVPESQTSWDQFRALQEKLLIQLRGVWQLQWNSDTFQMLCMHQSIYTVPLDILHESVFHTQDLKFLQRWCWGFRSFRMWCFVTGWIIFWHFERMWWLLFQMPVSFELKMKVLHSLHMLGATHHSS